MDNFVTEIIPYGHENAITRAELATRLGESDRVIRDGINKSDKTGRDTLSRYRKKGIW